MIELDILKCKGCKELAIEIQKRRNDGWMQIGNMVVDSFNLFFYQQMEKVTIDPITPEEREHSRL